MESDNKLTLAKPLATTRELAKHSWNIFASRWSQLLSLEVFAILPTVVFSGIVALIGALVFAGSDSLSISSGSISTSSIVLLGVLGLVAIIGTVILIFWGAAAKIVYLKNVRTESSIMPALKESWGMLRGFVGVGLLQGLVVVGGFILLVIPGVYFLIKVLFAQYVYVFERERGVRGIAALRRSSELTKGFWWGISTRLLVLSIFIGIFQMVVRAVLSAGSEASVISGSQTFAGSAMIISVVVSLVFSLVTQAYYSVFQYTLFEQLYQIKNNDPHVFHPFSLGKRIGFLALLIVLPLLFMIISVFAAVRSGTFTARNTNANSPETSVVMPTTGSSIDSDLNLVPLETPAEDAVDEGAAQ